MEKPTHASIKFIEDGYKTKIEVKNIIEFEDDPPADCSDFDKLKVYTCWYKDEKYPTLTKYAIQIGSLFDGEMDKKRRGNFPPLNLSTIEDYYEKNESNQLEAQGDSERAANKLQMIKKRTKLIEKSQQDDIIKKKMNIFISDPLETDVVCKVDSKLLESKSNKVDFNLTTSDTEKEEIQNMTNVEGDLKIANEKGEITENISKNRIAKLMLENATLKKELDCLKSKNEQLKIIQSEHESLKKKYCEQNDRIDSLKFLNEKLQMMLFVKEPVVREGKNIKDSTGTNSLMQEISSSRAVSPLSPKNFELNKSFSSSTPKTSDRYRNYQQDFSNLSDEIQKHNTLENDSRKSLFAEEQEYEEQRIDCLSTSTHSPKQRHKRNIIESDEEDSPSEKGYSNDKGKSTEPDKKKRKEMADDKGKSTKKRKEMVENDEEDSSPEKGDLNHKGKSAEPNKKKRKEMADESPMGKKFLEKFDNDSGEKMIYIKHGLCMPYNEWKRYLTKAKTASRFTKLLLRYFYDPDDLTKRCIKPGEKIRTPGGIHRRVELSPKKSDAIEKCLEYFIRKIERIEGDKAREALLKKNHYFSEEINKAMQEAKKKA